MNYDEMDVVFIQHQMDLTFKTQNYFIEKGLVGIHYAEDLLSGKDRTSTNPDDYKPRARRVLNRMRRICSEGAIAVGYYNKFPPNKMIIGVIPTGSEINPTLRELRVDEDYPDGKTCYKTIQLADYFEVDLKKNRQLESCIPRGNVFVKWRVNGIDRTIRYLFKLHQGLVTEKDRNVYDLSYSQLEVLCSEYLRKVDEDYRIDYFTTPVGRSQKSTDIDGVNDNGSILAQVSFSSNYDEVTEKMQNLLQYKGDSTKLLYFGPKSQAHLTKDHIKYIPIEQVFTTMKNTLLMKNL